MKFAVERAGLLDLLNSVQGPHWLKLSAAGEQVRLQSSRAAVATAATVQEEGECWLPRKLFAGLVRSHTNKAVLHVEASAREFRIERFQLRSFNHTSSDVPFPPPRAGK